MNTLPYAAFTIGLSISAILVAVRLTSLHPLSAVRVGAVDLSAAAFWLLTSGLGLISSSLSTKFFLLQLEFVGVVLVPPCWLMLTLIISGQERWVNRRNIAILSLMPIITLALVLTNQSHALVFSSVKLNPINPRLPLIVTPGLLFGFVVVYSYVVISAGIIMIVKRLLLSRRSFRVQAYPMLIASSIPWVCNMIYLYNQTFFGYIEPTALTLTLAGAVWMWRTVHWPRTYIAPVAHEVLIDNMSDSVIVLDYKRRVVDMNPMAEKLIHRSFSNVIGQTIESTWPEWACISKLLDERAQGIRELSFGNDDMKRCYELESVRLPGLTTEEINLLITLRDITERKMMEEKVRLYSEHLTQLVETRTAQLAEAQRLAAIGETTTMVGHDLRNPLQAMSIAVYLMERLIESENAGDKKEAAELLRLLDDNVRYMDKIVSDLQDYARPISADLVMTKLSELVREVVANVKIPENVQVAMDIDGESPNLRLDTALFTRVLTNLILNAVQAMPIGGKLTIVGRVAERITMKVQDTGVGIAPENLPKIFDPFFTTKARGQGLGLSVCKRLIEAQGGTINVTSEVGKGSVFEFEIPASEKITT